MSTRQIDKALADLIRMSKQAGENPAWTQGSSGNTSVKTADGKYMFIKASGTALKNMSIKRGWRRLRPDKVLSIINDDRLARLTVKLREREVANRLLFACDDNRTNEGTGGGAPDNDIRGQVNPALHNFTNVFKPSIEAPLHALLDKCVIHLHPIAVGAYVSAKSGREEIARLFKNQSPPPLWIPHASSGFALAKKAGRLINEHRRRFGIAPSIMFLAKHGLFVSARTPDEAIRLAQNAIKCCNSNLPRQGALRRHPPAKKDVRSAKSAIQETILAISGKRPNVSFFFNRDIAEFISRKDAGKLLAKGPLSAAEVIYAGGSPVWFERPDIKEITARLKSASKKAGGLPAAFVVKGLGLFVAAERKTASAIAEVETSSLIVRSRATKLGGVLALTRQEQDFIKQCYSPQSK